MKRETKVLLLCLIIIMIYTDTSYGWFGKKKKIDWPSAEVTEENIRAALSQKPSIDPLWKDSNFAEKITKIEITDHAAKPGQKIINIWYEMGDVWDETDLVKKAGGTTILINSMLFQNDKVEWVTVFAQAKMTDQYGNTELEPVVKIGITKEIANKVNWEGLAEKHAGSDPGNIYRIADNYNIHYGVLKRVKLDKIRLK
ncbi:hypothetical protein [Acetomicrobium sp. S15 = DSM 107314]|uniref:hypothetical protein n=1 Tax=Acetomicrobium sp. S15 = DSM 107314 TaxID=2529858 RepID=UPI0018E1A99C|nr:hypothetical protein [Acetomicrobium sp. S15 = DSM 107314]